MSTNNEDTHKSNEDTGGAEYSMFVEEMSISKVI